MKYSKSNFLDPSKYNGIPSEELIKNGIWRSKTKNGFAYQLLSTMADQHLERCTNTDNIVFLEAIHNELVRRKNLSEEIKNKIKNLMNTPDNSNENLTKNVNETQSEMDSIVNEAKTEPVASTTEEGLDHCFENPYEQRYKDGDIVGGYTILKVYATANNRGYLYLVKDPSGKELVISQAKFLAMMGQPPAINRRKKNNTSTKTKVVETKVSPINQNPEIMNSGIKKGDILGKYEVLDVRPTTRGPKPGFSVLCKDITNPNAKPVWIKRSLLVGFIKNAVKQDKIVKNTAQPVNREVEKLYEAVPVAINQEPFKITPKMISNEVSKMSWWQKAKLFVGIAP